MISSIRLPGTLQRRLNSSIHSCLYGLTRRESDFNRPLREEALVSAQSVSWRIFKNPIALFVGGTAAVILELAEPSVRAGIWEYSSFRKNPLGRLQRSRARRPREPVTRQAIHGCSLGCTPRPLLGSRKPTTGM